MLSDFAFVFFGSIIIACCLFKETQMVVKAMCVEVLAKCPEFEGVLVPMCQYHGGVCHEMKSCRRAGE